MSLCDRCTQPGACCKRFTLNIPNTRSTVKAQDQYLTREHPELPFRVLEMGELLDGKRHFTYYCPKLSPDGRCTIYEDRPWTCSSFEAGSDPLCVMYRPSTGIGDG